MKARRILRLLIILIVLASNVGCDQVSKNIVRQNIIEYERISLLHNYLTITKVENTGAFLSVGSTLPLSLRIALLTVLPVIVLVLAVVYLFIGNKLSNSRMIGICFVAGGGIGNLYDRIMHGSVTDFLHLDFGFFQTGIFNMADVSIMIGTFLILADAYVKRSNPLTDQSN